MPSVSIGDYYSNSGSDQTPARVSVVIPTIGRPSLLEALQSIFDQDLKENIQILIGVDKAAGDLDEMRSFLEARPAHVSCLVMRLPYSTSRRHGGVHNPTDGGSLRAVLSLMANARYVAYLDDDNRWRANHLSEMLKAVEGKLWAYSHRMLIDETTKQEIAIDAWDSVGPGRGRFAGEGGLVDTNCMIVDKVGGVLLLSRWATSHDGSVRATADRTFFNALSRHEHGVVQDVTVDYYVRSDNILTTFVGKGREFEVELGFTYQVK
jgi:glycosyltransferase involved in cell wall biosynthesis